MTDKTKEHLKRKFCDLVDSGDLGALSDIICILDDAVTKVKEDGKKDICNV